MNKKVLIISNNQEDQNWINLLLSDDKESFEVDFFFHSSGKRRISEPFSIIVFSKEITEGFETRLIDFFNSYDLSEIPVLGIKYDGKLPAKEFYFDHVISSEGLTPERLENSLMSLDNYKKMENKIYQSVIVTYNHFFNNKLASFSSKLALLKKEHGIDTSALEKDIGEMKSFLKRSERLRDYTKKEYYGDVGMLKTCSVLSDSLQTPFLKSELSLIFDQLHLGVCIYNLEGEILYYNSSFCEIFEGEGKIPVVGRPIEDVFCPDDCLFFREKIKNPTAETIDKEFEKSIIVDSVSLLKSFKVCRTDYGNLVVGVLKERALT